MRFRRFSFVVFAAFLLLLPFAQAGAQTEDSLTGRLAIAHPGFEEHVFVASYVYVFELNLYVDVDSDGMFSVEGMVDGRYALKTYVPGFKPTYRTIEFPLQRELVVPIELQMVELDRVAVEHRVPAYLGGVRSLLGSSDSTDGNEGVPPPGPGEFSAPTPGTDPTAVERPTIDFKRIFNSLFRRKRDRDE